MTETRAHSGRIILAMAAIGMMAIPASLHAQEKGKPAEPAEGNPHVWQPRTRSVAVFKNGMGFFLREGEAALHDGWLQAREIPPAAFGTLMIFSQNKDEIVDVVGAGPGEVVEFDGVDAPKDPASKRARLQAALQLKVHLSYTHKGAIHAAAGKLVSVGADFVVLESPENNFAVPLEGITKLQLLELPLRAHLVNETGKPPAKSRIGMAYLREGITWIPEYSLRILDDATAELTLRGTLVNEAEDLVHCDVNFVVGVPHFAHTNYRAPVAVGQVIRTIGAAVAPSEVRTQIMNRAGLVTNAAPAGQFEAPGGLVDKPVPAGGGKIKETLGTLPVLEGPGSTDYTVYTKKDLTLRVGEKAIVTLFVKKVRYSHIYRWSPPASMEHFLVLHNDTDTAWTTGPYLAISGDRPLSEDLLRYTPKGGRCELPVSAAVNVAHDKTETEVDRKFRAHSPATNTFYDLVTLEGDLRLRNFEKTAVDIVIVTQVPGKPTDATDNGIKASDPDKLQLLQRLGTIRWTIQLKPQETRTIRYKYERYVPSN